MDRQRKEAAGLEERLRVAEQQRELTVLDLEDVRATLEKRDEEMRRLRAKNKTLMDDVERMEREQAELRVARLVG